MQVAVVGTGYVGLVTGACLAYVGHAVTCLDIDEEKIAGLQRGLLPIYEPGLEALVREQLGTGALRFSSDYADTVPGAQAVFICVGTPPLPDGSANMSAVQSAATRIGEHLGQPYTVVVNKSTVPIGSGDWVGMLMREGLRHRAHASSPAHLSAGARPEAPAAQAAAVAIRPPEFDVVSNPEFLREGSAVMDALYPDRIVIGSDSERAMQLLSELYRPILEQSFPPPVAMFQGEMGATVAARRSIPLLVTDRTSAEMIKYAANAFLATKISFINEIANLCEKVGADVSQVAKGIGLDGRIGEAFLSAGIGWGGSCFPKDLASLCHTAREYDYECRLLAAAQVINQEQRLLVIRKLQERLKVLKGKRITLWGLAFKPGTDDVREAPAYSIARRLLELGARVCAYDPVAISNARRWELPLEFAADPYEAVEESDATVVVTEWPEIAQLDWSLVKERMRRPLVIDGRNFLPRAELLWRGFEYCGIGR
jgi:UDPglucose 6-dehydrogenase